MVVKDVKEEIKKKIIVELNDKTKRVLDCGFSLVRYIIEKYNNILEMQYVREIHKIYSKFAEEFGTEIDINENITIHTHDSITFSTKVNRKGVNVMTFWVEIDKDKKIKERFLEMLNKLNLEHYTDIFNIDPSELNKKIVNKVAKILLKNVEKIDSYGLTDGKVFKTKGFKVVSNRSILCSETLSLSVMINIKCLDSLFDTKYSFSFNFFIPNTSFSKYVKDSLFDKLFNVLCENEKKAKSQTLREFMNLVINNKISKLF